MKLFSNTERRGVIFLAPLLAVVILLAAVYEMRDRRVIDDAKQLAVVERTSQELKPFNPNVDSYEQLRDAGVPAEVAVGIVRWRRYGKVYRMVEDLALVSGVNDSLYAELKPFVVIDESVVAQPKPDVKEEVRPSVRTKTNTANSAKKKPAFAAKREPFAIDTASVEYLAGWGLSTKQAEVVVKYRDASGGIFSEEHLRRCYVIDDAVADSMVRYIIYSERKPDEKRSDIAELKTESDGGVEQPLVEINSADSAALVAIDGIGPKSASEIIKYRNLLGGYYSVEQISELKCIMEQNFVKFLPKILCDSCKISKIDINFAGPKELERHPYVSAKALRRIIKQRQLKGGWTRIEEMTEQNILSDEEAKRLAPYLRFGSEPLSR
ncbi:MAG: helix-hairpin-helix domain-containing protein [Alistipes sp.]|nr:helix-hairpin-helix domain-containing protein [Alistipes sp.]